VKSVSDRAHARDIAELERQVQLRRARFPLAIKVSEALCEEYFKTWRTLGSHDPDTEDLLHVSDAVLDEMGAGRDLPQEIADAVMAILEGRA
jgi:hypothetical protein